MNYQEIRKHPPDFEVRYRFFQRTEGGRKTGAPWQHYRCDWVYDGDDISKTGIFMIHPEFTDEDGTPLPEGIPVPMSGIATMWILSPEMRGEMHRARIRDGVRGYFMEGGWKVAEAVVTRCIALGSNPDKSR